AAPLALALPCAVSMALLVLGPAGRTVDVVWAPLDLVQITRDSLGRPPLAGAALVAWPVLWIVASLGLRILGLDAAVRALRAGAAPPTVRSVVRKVLDPPDPLPAPMVRAMGSLERASQPGDVVLQRPGARFPPAPVILIGRRVPYERFTPYLTQFATREELER